MGWNPATDRDAADTLEADLYFVMLLLRLLEKPQQTWVLGDQEAFMVNVGLVSGCWYEVE